MYRYSNFIKRIPFITVLQNTRNPSESETTENARAEGLIPASTVWYEILATAFHFCDMYFFCDFQNRPRKI